MFNNCDNTKLLFTKQMLTQREINRIKNNKHTQNYENTT